MGIGQTSAVGHVPGRCKSPCGALDMSGNVWEWCLNEYKQSEQVQLAGDNTRVIRGSAFGYYSDYARCAVREGEPPDVRGWGIGFRVDSWASLTVISDP